jgi:hypothetical protein
MRHQLWKVTVTLTALFVGGCDMTIIPDGSDTSVHPKDYHPIFPDVGEGWQIASGVVQDEALAQPIQFTHYRHVTVLEMDCQYCHSEARRSIHSGVPPVEVCMGCHQHVKTDSEEIKKIAAAWEAKEPIAWAKVHDLPDYVQFTHKRHIKAGLDCTECHGQIGLQGQWPNGNADEASVLKRETSLQMGWCLECHATHPSIDDNYGDLADLRRAELKDCWTCHK